MNGQFLGAQLVMTCQRDGCDAQEIVGLGEEPWHQPLAMLVGDEIPDGWGWDYAGGADGFLHCPDHRG